ncbi:MAG: tyrosine-type recombinase/integrase [Candidatus Binataceae bacterium]
MYQPTYLDKGSGERKKASTWWIQYSVEGTRFRESSNSCVKQEAEQLLRSGLEAAGRGEPVGATSSRKITFEQLAQILLDDYQAKGRRSIGRVQHAVAHLRRFFGEIRVSQIDRDLIGRYAVLRQKQMAAAATINRELAALRRALNLAQSEGKVTSLLKISMLPEQCRSRGCIEDHEYRIILDNLPEHLRPAIQTAYITGWRINSEILTLRKRAVDLASGCLRLTPVEMGEQDRREFPLTPELREVLVQELEKTRQLEVLRGEEVPWLFHRTGRPIKSFRKAWAVGCQRAGVHGKVPDDLRRTAVRNLEYAGVPRSIAMTMVGHRSDSIYRSIAPVDSATLKDVALKIAAFHRKF